MKITDFNSRINLPKFCQKLGHHDYQYVKIPIFGWYAYSTDKTFIGNIFDFMGPNDRDKLYSFITKEKPEYLDFDLPYNEISESRLKAHLFENQLWQAAYAMSRKEIDNYRPIHNGKRVSFRDLLNEHGLNGFIKNGIGVVTHELLNKFSMLPWPRKDLIVGKLLIPTFCTPKHIASLEYAPWNDLRKLKPLYINDEKGWYGNISSNHVLSNFSSLATNEGFIWNSKADFWTSSIVDISEDMDVRDCIKIWTEANNTLFKKSPIEIIKDNKLTGEIKYHVNLLNHTQLQKIEKETNEPLLNYWKKAREEHLQIGKSTFCKRDNRYFVSKKGELIQITNFAVQIDRIISRDNKFYRIGVIAYGDSYFPFEMEEKYFSTDYLFHRGVKEKFLQMGIGIPIIHPDFYRHMLLIINSFNSAVKIEIEDEGVGVTQDLTLERPES